jgi:hypothetical protein
MRQSIIFSTLYFLSHFKKMHTPSWCGGERMQYSDVESDGTSSYLWLLFAEWVKSLTPEQRWRGGIVTIEEGREIKRKFRALRKLRQRMASEPLDENTLAEIDTELFALAP